MPSWMALTFQDSASPIMMELNNLHDYIMVIMLSIMVLISYLLILLMISKNSYKYLSEGTLIETIWSIIPASVLMILVIPSVKVLYYIEDSSTPALSFKIMGHQWYWSFFSPFLFNMKFMMKNTIISGEEDMSVHKEEGVLRLLDNTTSLVLPSMVSSRLMVSSADVIHSFAVPALGLKVDAVPGRINQLSLSPNLVGNFYGQCSEICGTNHSFMPITMMVRSVPSFIEMNKSLSSDLMLEV